MKKLGLPKKYILPLLLCMNSSVFAETKGLYGIIRKSAGINNEATAIAKIKGLVNGAIKDSDTSEWDIFYNQLSSLIEKRKTAEEKPLYSELRKKTWDIFSFNPDYGFYEAGLGYYFQLVMPFAGEFKVLSEQKKDAFHFFWSGAFKVFLPLGEKTKLYAKVGKCFFLNPGKASESILPIDNAIFKDIKKTVLESTPQQQWALSRTFLGVGIIRKVSSKIELDFSAEGYTTRDTQSFYFTTSLGINYLFN